MTQEINNENNQPQNPNEEPQQETQDLQLQPVASTPKKILSLGMKIVIGGGIFMLIGSILMPSTRGSTRSSRLELEQRQAEFKKAIQAEKAKEELKNETTTKEDNNERNKK